jgi:ectoine hydroxylase-related dioxygenase (phytanoyl-CoA dioxygenase family)
MLQAEQVRFFADNGFVKIPALVPTGDLNRLREVCDRLQADAIAKLAQPGYMNAANRLNKGWIEHPTDHYVYREKPNGQLSFHRVERCFEQDPVFAVFAMSARLLATAWSVLQRPFWPRGGSLVVKLPQEGAEVRWHQDIPYLYWSSGGHPSTGRPVTHPVPNFNTDIYLEPSTRENGCLWAIPGTHRNGTVDVDALKPKDGTWRLAGSQPLEAEPGDVMLHHVAVAHGSPENRSPVLRRTFYVHYMNDATVQDAYSDWPNLLSPDELQRFWGAALAERRAAAADERELPQFKVTPGGLAPA